MNVINHKAKGSQIVLTIAAFVIVVAGMSAAQVILVPFLLAAFIAIISAPPLFWLQRKGLSTWLAFKTVNLKAAHDFLVDLWRGPRSRCLTTPARDGCGCFLLQ